MRINVIYGGIGALALTSTVLAGCNREAPEPAAPAVAEQRGTFDDESLATYVQSRFYTDDAVRESDIDVTAENGTVTLRGTVETEAARQHAVQVARQTDGVSEVNDQLRVETAPDAETASNRPVEGGVEREDERSPSWITTKIQSQFFLDPEIKPWNIEVNTSQDGVVTLRGEVEEPEDRQEAERIAKSTEGVARVVNRLRVRSETPMASKAERGATETADAARAGIDRPDAWVTAKIQSKYFMDASVKGLDVNVDTDGGVVTLSGEVDSQAERRQALALARNTEGVRSVKDNIRVAPSAEAEKPASGDRSAERTDAAAVNDAWITTKIQSKYFLDGDVKALDVNVDTQNGVVTLKGTVESDAQKQAAAAIAQETEGVTKVNNQLQVQAAVPERQ